MSIMRTDRKPPLARSPMRLRPRRVLRSTQNTLQTPPGIRSNSSLSGSLKKTQFPNQESELRPEYHTISFELRALAKMVGKTEFGDPELDDAAAFGSKSSGISVFERGRFYEEYSARRNERLKKKKGEETGEAERKNKNVYGLGVKVESAKKRESKKLEGLRKSVFSTPVMTTADRRENQRYLLRSMTKENKKPPLPPVFFDKSVGGDRKTAAARRVRKI